MAKVELTPGVLDKLEQIDRFYSGHGEAVADRARQTIFSSLRKIALHPSAGRPQVLFANPAYPSLREVVIPFGATGFIVLYRHDQDRDVIVILALKHQREAAYPESDI
jgi:plasmid stabilization system protein ParE